MERSVAAQRLCTLGALLVAGLAVVGGCPLPGPQGPEGPQGPAGPPGPAGPAGRDAGADLPGTVVTITDVSGASPVASGGPLSVTFTLATAAGEAIGIDELDRFSIYVSGPATNYQRVIVPEDERDTSIAQNADGSYTYTFAGGFPGTYAAPANDSDAFGTADGELTGQPVTPGTYTVGIEARRTFEIEGEQFRDAGDATFDFALDGATLAPRQVVLEENCEKCHRDLTVHGQNRFSVTGCVLCHTRGAEDRVSSAPDKQTPGVSIQFAQMIHKIHRGDDLPRVAASANSADPYRYQVIGYAERLHDFSEVAFPVMPDGVARCDACHGGAAQADQIYADENINRFNCTSCHDDLDFTSGTILDFDDPDVAGGLLTQAQLGDAAFRKFPSGVQHLFADGACMFCHGAGQTWAVQTVHQHETSTAQEGSGLSIEIVAVGGQSGGGGSYFVPGDFPQITFRLKDPDGNPVQLVAGDPTVVDRVAFVVAGPTSIYQHIIPGQDQSRVRPWNNGALNVDNPANWIDNFAVDGTYTYIFEPAGASSKSTAWPANYPAARNALPNQNFPFAAGWGQLYTAAGTPLDEGTYTVVAYGRRLTATSGLREPIVADTFNVRFGSDGDLEPYPGTVSDDKCNACHAQVAFHGNSRAGVRACLACHTPGVQITDTGTDNLDLRVMIHKIHNARNLSTDYILVGDEGPMDFSSILLPSMPGQTRHCDVCHATDAWKEVPARTDDAGNPIMQTWMVVCSSCHDSATTAAHIQLNTLAGAAGQPGTEGCAVCHGPDAAFSVQKSHQVR